MSIYGIVLNLLYNFEWGVIWGKVFDLNTLAFVVSNKEE
jgi:hypothetical protein